MIPPDTHLQIGSLLFEGLDQIDLTVRDVRGLRLTPDAAIADAPQLDLLHVPGGFGQEALMEDEPVLDWIRDQAAGARCLFSVCTESEPPFDSGTPETAPQAVLDGARKSVATFTGQGEQTAWRVAQRLGIVVAA
jgi:hypothetical protein